VRLIIAAISLICSGAVAGDAPATQPTFAEVTAQLAAPAVLRGNFSQARRIALLQNPLYSTGHFILSDRGLYWRQEQPIAALMIADEQRLMQQVGDGPMQDIDTAENPVVLSFSNSFLSIFRGNEDELRKNFDVEFSSEPGWWIIHLKPISYPMSEAIDSISLRGREYIETITVISRSSDETIISFTELQTEPDRLTDDELELYAQ
jgi:hypothetical protein